MKKSQVHPCQLFGILARVAPIGVLLRRGPSKWVQLSIWHVDTDSIEHGQWFHGRVYERRCDVSPDGSKFIYFASKYSGGMLGNAEAPSAWTAISKPPYFTALALWPNGHSWNGGGLFADNMTIWSNFVGESCKGQLPQKFTIIPGQFGHGEDRPIYYKHLARDGWSLVQEDIWPKLFSSTQMAEQPSIWHKQRPQGRELLVMKHIGHDFRRYGSPYILEYSVQDPVLKSQVRLEGAEWAEWDQRNRLVFTKDGHLFVDELSSAELHPQEIADFNGQQPYQMEAPDWAKAW